MERDCHSRVVPDKICYIEGNRYSCISNENETLIDGKDVYWCYENICDKYLDIKGQRYSRGLSIVTVRKRCFKTSM